MDMGKTSLSYMPRMTLSPIPYFNVKEDKSITKEKTPNLNTPKLVEKLPPRISIPHNPTYSNQKVFSYQYDKVSVFSIQGRRSTMEDKFRVVQQKAPFPLMLFGVFDGHGGSFAVECVESRLIPNVLSALNQNLKTLANQKSATPTTTVKEAACKPVDRDRSAMYHRVLSQEIMALDRSLLQKASSLPDNSGTTCLLGLLFDNELIIANAGDCRAIMYDSRGRTLQLTIDHKPQNPAEKERIRQAGGFVTLSGASIWRLNGILSVSRGLGDLSLKRCNNVITARPDIHVYPLVQSCTDAPNDGPPLAGGDQEVPPLKGDERRITGSKDEHPQLEPYFLVAASDGLWNVMSNAEISRFLLYPVDRISTEPDYGARALSLRALALGSTDNVTVLIVKFNYPKRSAANQHAGDIGSGGAGPTRTPSPPPHRRNFSSGAPGPYVDTRIAWHRGPEALHKSLLRKSQQQSQDATVGKGVSGRARALAYTPPPPRCASMTPKPQSSNCNGDIPIPVQYCNRSKTPPPPFTNL